MNLQFGKICELQWEKIKAISKIVFLEMKTENWNKIDLSETTSMFGFQIVVNITYVPWEPSFAWKLSFPW